MVKNPPASAGDVGSVPGWGRSPGGGNESPLQYSCLGNPWTEEPSGLQSRGSQRVRHDLVTELSPLILKLHQQSAEIEKCLDQQPQEPQP